VEHYSIEGLTTGNNNPCCNSALRAEPRLSSPPSPKFYETTASIPFSNVPSPTPLLLNLVLILPFYALHIFLSKKSVPLPKPMSVLLPPPNLPVGIGTGVPPSTLNALNVDKAASYTIGLDDLLSIILLFRSLSDHILE
jgi:hypothetical protein